MRLEAARMFRQVLQAAPHERTVIYYGAANLSPSKDELDAAINKLGHLDESDPAIQFKVAFDAILGAGTNVEMVRFIRLFSKEEFSRRGDNFKASHLSWFQGQLHQLETFERYSIGVSPRAPEWGGAISLLVAADTVLFMIGQGSSAILVRGSDVTKEIIEHAEEFMNAAAPENRPHFYNKGSAAALRSRLVSVSGIPLNGPADKKEESGE